MERASSAPLRSLITALAVVLGVAAIWAAAALADGSGDSGSSAGPDGARVDFVQSGDEQTPDDELPFGEEDFFGGGGGEGFFDDEDCPFGERGFDDDGPQDDGPQNQPEGDPDQQDAADL